MIKKINLSNLMRDKKGNFDWEKSIGAKLDFTYDDIEGFIEIVSYNKNTNKVKIKYDKYVKTYNPTNIIYCNIKEILGIINEYKFQSGEVIKDFKIKKHIWLNHNRAYLCKCLKCNEEVEILQTKFIKSKTIQCPNCYSK